MGDIMRIRSRLALFIGRIISLLGGQGLRNLGWPGRVSRWIDPNILEELAGSLVINVVTGSNGAVTTGALTAHGLRSLDLDCMINSPEGQSRDAIITMLLKKRNQTHAILVTALKDVAEVIAAVPADVLTVTTLSLDQTLDRGMIDKVLGDVKKALTGRKPSLVLCSDDPLVSSISIDNVQDDQDDGDEEQTFFYAEAPYRMQKTTEDALKSPYRTSHCPLCSRELIYDAVGTGGVGLYHCTNCGFRNPRVDLYYQMQENWLTVKWLRSGLNPGAPTLRRESRFHIRGDLTARYAAAALGTLHRLLPAADPVKLQNAVCSYRPQFTQHDYIFEQSKRAIVQVVSEMHSMDERLEMISREEKAYAAVIRLSNPPRVAVDNSWIWDIDYSRITFPENCRIILTGEDAPLLWLSLLQQEIDTSGIQLLTDKQKLSDELGRLTEEAEAGGSLYIFTDPHAIRPFKKMLVELGYRRRASALAKERR